jgi:hypothetical protein
LSRTNIDKKDRIEEETDDIAIRKKTETRGIHDTKPELYKTKESPEN